MLTAAPVAAGAGATALSTPVASETLLLDVVVNGYRLGLIGEFAMVGEKLMVRRKELRALGFRVAAAPVAIESIPIAVASLTGVTYRIDRATQSIFLTATDANLQSFVLHAGASPNSAGKLESGLGAVFNYDVVGTYIIGQPASVAGVFEFRAYSPWGVVSNTMLATGGGARRAQAIRLDTNYVFSDGVYLRRYRGGDIISGGLAWTRPVRLGGLQIASDFSIRPDLITFPVPIVRGTTAVPTTVDLLVNGARQLSSPIAPGPFQVTQLPVVSGAGNITLTYTDALGRQVSTTQSYYASVDLLTPGLRAFSIEAGAVRRDFGVVSNDYGALAASASYRQGLTPQLTIEAHVEGTSSLLMGGGGVVVQIGNLGIINIALAGSAASGRLGTQLAVSARRTGRTFTIGLDALITGRDFADIAAIGGSPVSRRQVSANAGLSLGRLGSLGIAFTGLNRDEVYFPTGLTPGSGIGHSRLLTGSYSVELGPLSLFANGYKDFIRHGGSGVVVGITLPLDRRRSANVNAGTGSGGIYGQAEIRQSAITIGDWGFRLFGSKDSIYRTLAEVEHKLPWTFVSAGVDQNGSQTTVQTNVRGSLAYVDHSVFATNLIDDSFAVVETDGTAGVPILFENRDVGRTGRSGRLLVPELRSFITNHLSIDPDGLPVDIAIDFTKHDVRPQDRSGVVVRFPMRLSHGALVKLVDATGTPIALGSSATLAPGGEPVPVGYDGGVYIEGLGALNDLLVQRTDGAICRVHFSYNAISGEIPAIGPLRCVAAE